MNKKQEPGLAQLTETSKPGQSVTNDRLSWQEPRLKFIEPKLTERGSVKDLTGGFFGTFRP